MCCPVSVYAAHIQDQLFLQKMNMHLPEIESNPHPIKLRSGRKIKEERVYILINYYFKGCTAMDTLPVATGEPTCCEDAIY